MDNLLIMSVTEKLRSRKKKNKTNKKLLLKCV